jgi:hypothetical protein
LARVRVAGLVHQAGVFAEFGDDVAQGTHSYPVAAAGQERRSGCLSASMFRSFVEPGPKRGLRGVARGDFAVDPALAVADDHLAPPSGRFDPYPGRPCW